MKTADQIVRCDLLSEANRYAGDGTYESGSISVSLQQGNSFNWKTHIKYNQKNKMEKNLYAIIHLMAIIHQFIKKKEHNTYFISLI